MKTACLAALLISFTLFPLSNSQSASSTDSQAKRDKAKISKLMKHMKTDLESLSKAVKEDLKLSPSTQNVKIKAEAQRITIYYNDDEGNVLGICEDPPGYCRPCPC